jgi:hypothetical protein
VIKVFALLPRRPDITEQQFHTHWRTIHREHALRIGCLRRYVQAHRVPTTATGLAVAPYDGIPEVWHDDLASALALRSNPQYTRYAQRDEPNFIDMERFASVPTQEVVVRGGPSVAVDDPGAKVILMLRRRAGTAGSDFAAAWFACAPSALEPWGDVRRAVATAAVPESYIDGDPEYDGFAELFWPSLDALERDWAQMSGRVISIVSEVAALDRSHLFVAEEERVIWP